MIDYVMDDSKKYYDILYANRTDSTFVYSAIESGSVEVLKWVMEELGLTYTEEYFSIRCFSPIEYAAKSGSVAMLDHISKYFPIGFGLYDYTFPSTLLIDWKFLDCAKWLHRNGIILDCPDLMYKRALISFKLHSIWKTIEILEWVHNVLPENEKKPQESVLEEAIQSGSLTLVKTILSFGAEINESHLLMASGLQYTLIHDFLQDYKQNSSVTTIK
jgi:hypothetical protein